MTRIAFSELNEEQFRANRFELISRLADDLAHEIKNPLNAIVINLEVLKVRALKGDQGATVERAGVIEQETRRLHGLVDRLLQLLRPDREHAASLALDHAMDELLPLIEAQARLSRNETSLRCDAAVFVPVRRDAFRFAMLNVLMSVMSHLGEGGGTLVLECEVEAETVKLTATAQPGGTPLAAPGAEYERSLATAAALLGSCGGYLDAAGNAVTVVLPRGAAS